ncbi:MAG: S-methyl-5'-thioadenosine phosphorylase [Nitrospinota bacterium]|nr:S-methyl-5'-thioadenosine phosphorylase [Nitrospinota bacterium]
MSIGVIGGSGLYAMKDLKILKKEKVTTPFGDPSDEYVIGEIGGKEVVFLPRHGTGHRILPSELNFRANIYGMKILGVSKILSVSAVGSLKEEIKPGHIAFPDQFIDRTFARNSTFFGNGIVAHVSFADPICKETLQVVAEAAKRAGATIHVGGTYINMEGPQFSTRAESRMYRSWGASVIGMTNLNEAKLAREAEICYVTIALSTDYDCWYEEEEDVSTEAILEVIHRNVAMSQKIIKEAVGSLGESCGFGCHNMMANTIMTDPTRIPDETKKRLNPIIGKYIK